MKMKGDLGCVERGPSRGAQGRGALQPAPLWVDQLHHVLAGRPAAQDRLRFALNHVMIYMNIIYMCIYIKQRAISYINNIVYMV